MAVIRQHIMLSYQWDIQPLVQSVYARLDSMGYPVWMDVEGGMSGSINDSMASAVENAFVVVPFMTAKYQASKSCKKELNYADTLDKNIVPCMAERFKPSGWLGIITAGMLWMDFRNPDNLEQSIDSLIAELNHYFGDVHLLGEEEIGEPSYSSLFLSTLSSFLPLSGGWDVIAEGAVPAPGSAPSALEEVVRGSSPQDQPRPRSGRRQTNGLMWAVARARIAIPIEEATAEEPEQSENQDNRKFQKSRAMLKYAAQPAMNKVARHTFCNASSDMYLTRQGNMLSVEVTKDCYWIQERRKRCLATIYIKNYVSKEHLVFNTHGRVGATRVEPGVECEWNVMTDGSDETGRRAVVVWNEHEKLFLAVVEGRLEGVTQQGKACTWYLESGGDRRSLKKIRGVKK